MRQAEANISGASMMNELPHETKVNVGAIRSGIGKMGVALRYHTDEEYKALTKAQKQELW